MKDSPDSELSITHLQLLPKAHNRLLAKKIFTIGELIKQWDSGNLELEGLGPRARSDIKKAVEDLKEATGKKGRIDWNRFFEDRKISNSCITFTSEPLGRLSLTERLLPIGALHLRKSYNALKEQKIIKVGELVDRAREGIKKMKGAGNISHREITEALSALTSAIQPDGSVDWEGFAKKRDFMILPKGTGKLENRDPLGLLVELSECISKEQFNERSYQIIRRRFLVKISDRATLKTLSETFGIERERVRQLQVAVLNAIRKSIFEEDYRGMRFRLQKGVSGIFKKAKEHYERGGRVAWKRCDWLFELEELWGSSRKDLLRYADFLMVFFGYESNLIKHPDLEPLVVTQPISQADWRQLVESIRAIYNSLHKHNEGLEASEIAEDLMGTSHPVKVDQVPILARLCSGIERHGKCFRIVFEHLRGRAEQAFRVLSERGKPTYYIDLLEEINARLPKSRHLESKESFTNQLSYDPRFAPVGKSGNWTLKRW